MQKQDTSAANKLDLLKANLRDAVTRVESGNFTASGTRRGWTIHPMPSRRK
jgi:hypothetical protein